MSSAFENNRKFEADTLPEVKAIISRALGCLLVDIENATPEEDMKEATDLVIRPLGLAIAVRVRKGEIVGRHGLDWSIRARSKGYKTEVHKMVEQGYGDLMFTGWCNEGENTIKFWAIVDLNILRAGKKSGELRMVENDNRDGTAGEYVKLADIEEIGGVLHTNVKFEVDKEDHTLGNQLRAVLE